MNHLEQLPLDDDMIERAGAALNDLVGHQIKRGVTNPYIDVDDYVKRLCRLYAEQTLNAAFHGVAKMQTWTAEQVRENGQSALERFMSGGPVKRDECEKYGFKPGGVTMARCSTGDQVEAAVERVLRRQESKASNPSNTRVIDAAGKTQEQVIAEAKEAMKDGDWRITSITPSKPRHAAEGLV